MVELVLNQRIYRSQLNGFISTDEFAFPEHIKVGVDLERVIVILGFVQRSLAFILSLLGPASSLLFRHELLAIGAVGPAISFFHLESLLDFFRLRLTFLLHLSLVTEQFLGFLAQDGLLVSAQAVENADLPLPGLE